jgi:hypothetical protein
VQPDPPRVPDRLSGIDFAPFIAMLLIIGLRIVPGRTLRDLSIRM